MNNVAALVKELELMTVELVQRLDGINYDELASFSDQRERLVEEMAAQRIDLTELDKQTLRSLSQYDSQIVSKMKFFKDEASNWLLRQGEIREQQSAYKANYSVGSMFFDSKK